MEKEKLNKKEEIRSKYMELVNETGEFPKSLTQFALKVELEEAEFYEYYSSFQSVEDAIVQEFYNYTFELLLEDELFKDQSAKDKVLSFYFTFFEVLTANRSYVLQFLSKRQKSTPLTHPFHEMKRSFLTFLKGLSINSIEIPVEVLEKWKQQGSREMGWTQFLIVLRFWQKDSSEKFEKTDAFIEKSVAAAFELLEISLPSKVLDFGKFVFNETFGKGKK